MEERYRDGSAGTSELVIGDVEPGQKASGMLRLPGGEFWVPATVIRGRSGEKTVLITAGIHAGGICGDTGGGGIGTGNTGGVSDRADYFDQGGEPGGFRGEKRRTSREDGKNLNREFPGSYGGTVTERLARTVVEALHREADYYVDLHSGDDYEMLTPYVYYAGKANRDVAEISRQMARQTDVPYMVRSEVGSGGSYNYAASCGIPSVLLERGGMGGWSLEEVQSMKKDVRSILDYLGI